MQRAKLIRAAALAVVAGGGLFLLNYLAPLQWPTVAVYFGLGLALLGLAGAVVPRAWSGLARRSNGLAVTAGGAALIATGLLWPAPAHATAAPTTRLDAFLPEYHFVERHEVRVHAAPDRVLAALRQMTFGDIGVMRALGRIRAAAMGDRVPEGDGGMAARRVIETMSNGRTGFFPLDLGERELVFGMAGQPWNNLAKRLTPAEFQAWAPPGNVKIAFNFAVEDAGGGWSRMVTETRVLATDDAARDKMAKYWRLIYPGSGMIRRSMLNAVRARAEAM